MKSKKAKVVVSVITAVIAACGVFFAGFFVGRIKDPDLAALEFILKTYKDHYYEVDDNCVEIMARSILDRYSEYYTAEEYEQMKKVSEGVRGGIGVSFIQSGNKVLVYSVLGNSPAERAGVKVGGVITGAKRDGKDYLAVDNRDTLGEYISAAALGEKFELTIDYDGTAKTFTLSREEYRETYVYYADSTGNYRYGDQSGEMKLDKYAEDEVGYPQDTAYIKYVSFNGNGKGLYASANQLGNALEKFKNGNKKKLILDLRGNGGGYMDICEDVAAYFVGAKNSTKPLIATAVYNGGKTEKFNSSAVKYGNYGYESIVVLANDGTASASEVLIGAMLDTDQKGIVKIVLERNENGVYRTYGKGIMQTTYPNLLGKDAIKLTTAKLFWNSGISIHGVGVTKNGEETAAYRDKIYEATYEQNCDYALKFALNI